MDKKVTKLPVKERPTRLLNWSLVTQIEADGTGVRIFFVDGRSIRDGRSIETVQALLEHFWRPR